jgi:hypothetical protein
MKESLPLPAIKDAIAIAFKFASIASFITICMIVRDAPDRTESPFGGIVLLFGGIILVILSSVAYKVCWNRRIYP